MLYSNNCPTFITVGRIHSYERICLIANTFLIKTAILGCGEVNKSLDLA